MTEDNGGVSGQPDSCPRCGGPGYLTHIDLKAGMQRQVCRTCATTWSTAVGPQEQPGAAPESGAGRLSLTEMLERAAERRAAESQR